MSSIKRILIVEDEFIIALLIERQLRKMGYEICGKVSSGQEAITLLRAGGCDVVLMDIKILGDMDGIETIKIVRSFSQIPVIYVTGNSDPRTREKANATNPAGYIIKPIEFGELDLLIRSATAHTPP